MEIIFNAFSFLQDKCRRNNIPYSDAVMDVPADMETGTLIGHLGLGDQDVEAVMINGKVVSRHTRLKAGDRVAFIPPGTPGPYRVLLGFYAEKA